MLFQSVLPTTSNPPPMQHHHIRRGIQQWHLSILNKIQILLLRYIHNIPIRKIIVHQSILRNCNNLYSIPTFIAIFQ